MKFNKQARQMLKDLGVPKSIRNNLNPRMVAYFAAAYFGLRYLNNRGILPQQTGAALDVIDRKIDQGIDSIKSALGLEEEQISNGGSKKKAV